REVHRSDRERLHHRRDARPSTRSGTLLAATRWSNFAQSGSRPPRLVARPGAAQGDAPPSPELAGLMCAHAASLSSYSRLWRAATKSSWAAAELARNPRDPQSPL